MELRRCKRCGQEKEIGEFLKCSSVKSGRRFWCRDCSRAYAREYSRRPNRQKYNRKLRERLKAEGYYRAYEKEWLERPGNREQRNEARKQYRQKPEVQIRNLARRYTNQMINNGTLKREPCAFCGVPLGEAHHVDYAQPLIIVWLCSKCHRKLHFNQSGEE